MTRYKFPPTRILIFLLISPIIILEIKNKGGDKVNTTTQHYNLIPDGPFEEVPLYGKRRGDLAVTQVGLIVTMLSPLWDHIAAEHYAEIHNCTKAQLDKWTKWAHQNFPIVIWRGTWAEAKEELGHKHFRQCGPNYYYPYM